jgi:hypothetical protein
LHDEQVTGPSDADYFTTACVNVTADRDNVLTFLADLSEPVDPWVLAGFGGPLARIRHARDFIEGERAVEDIKQRWANATDVARAVETLFEIASLPPTSLETERRAHDWDYELCDLLWRLAQRDRGLVESAMDTYAERGRSARIVRELESWLRDP